MPYSKCQVAGYRVENGSSLMNNLMAYWKMDEANGTRVDAHGPYDLTDNNTVTSNTGHVYATAANFLTVNSEYLNVTGVATSATDLTIAVWFRLDDLTNQARQFSLSLPADPGGKYYQLHTDATNGQAQFNVRGGSAISGAAGQFVAAGQWYLFIAWYTSSDKIARDSIDDGTIAEGSALDVEPPTGSFDCFIGSKASLDVFIDGRIGPVAIWNRVLTSAERTGLWNSGAGRTYPF